jgi:hypothetical protein
MPSATGLDCRSLYTVTVTDANGCTSTAGVTVTEPTQVTATISSFVTVSCFGDASGEATAAGSGGTGTYSFVLEHNLQHRTVPTATALIAGTYTVTISDVEQLFGYS